MSHSLGAKLSGLRHKGYITDDEYLRLKKALEQQPCGDAISRQAVLDINFKRIILTTAKPAETIEQKVKALPSVTRQQKTGRWIAHSDGIWIKSYECSRCGKVHNTQSDYCEKCGAKMVEPQESEE